MVDKKSSKDKASKSANADKDAIDTLPLSSIPLTTGALKNAKLIKNARMETTVEIYSDPLTGSLQITPDTIADFMETSPRDQEIINSLSGLHSFDVYSLRTSLKRLGVEIKDADALELSDDIKGELAGYNAEFVRPLIEKIFGKGRVKMDSKEGLGEIFRDPDVARVRENLRIMAEKTGIPLADIPAFLKEYGEVFLAVAYYRYSFEKVSADIDRFALWMQAVRNQRDVTASPNSLAQCRQVEDTLHFLATSIRERLAQFQSSFEMFWGDINRESFRQMRLQIEENHASMGAVLCGLVVKINHWNKEFSDNSVGGPSTRVKFVITEMNPGLTRLKELEQAARKRLELAALPV